MHTICGDFCGYLMTPHFTLQCTPRNKNVLIRAKGLGGEFTHPARVERNRRSPGLARK
jgi:hypothetical protein